MGRCTRSSEVRARAVPCAALLHEWVNAPGLRYVPVDGELDLLPGTRVLPAPGRTPATQIVVVETGGRPVVICGGAAVWFGELDKPRTAGQRHIRALDPEMVWLAHGHEPWRPGIFPYQRSELGLMAATRATIDWMPRG